MMPRRLVVHSCLAALALLLTGCPRQDVQTVGGATADGEADIWLFSNEPPLGNPKSVESRTVVEVDGSVTSITTVPVLPPTGHRAFYAHSMTPLRAVTIRTDEGIEWTLGYHVERGTPLADVTPDLNDIIGERVLLRFRAIRAFGSAPGFVLSDDKGVAFAIDLAVYGDPLLADDVPGLRIQDGATVGTTMHACFDQRHALLTFKGDQAIDVAAGKEGTVLIKGSAFAALNLFNYKAAGAIRCTDVAGDARAWAIWRR